MVLGPLWLGDGVTRPGLWPRRTARLVLRPPTEADLDQVLSWRNDPAVTRWMLRTIVEPESYRRAWLADAADPGDHSAVALIGSAVVGTATLSVTDSLGQGVKAPDSPWSASEARIGYTLDPSVHGRGLGTELALGLLSLAFDDLGLHRVTATCFADNHPSWRLLERVGMRREAHSVKDAWHAEHGWVDGYTYAILRTEWEGSEEQRVSAGWGSAPGASPMGQAG